MSRRVGDKFVIEEQPPAKCEFCGKLAELRPYGPNRENICFQCGMKNEKTTGEQFLKAIDNTEINVRWRSIRNNADQVN